MLKKAIVFLTLLLLPLVANSTTMELWSWSQFKQIAITNKNLSIQFSSSTYGYDVYGPDANNITWHYLIPVVDTTDANDFITNVMPYANQEIAGAVQVSSTSAVTTYQGEVNGSGSIDGLGETVVASPYACGSIAINITGTWAGALTFEASSDGVNYNVIPVMIPSNGLDTDFTEFNGFFVAPCGGYTNLEVIATIWNSGTANITWSSTGGGNYISQGVPGNAANAWPVYLTGGTSSIGTVSGSTVTDDQGTIPWITASTDSIDNVVVSTYPPTLTPGTTAPLYVSKTGALRLENVLSSRVYYVASSTLAVASTPSDIVSITGSSSKTIRVSRVEMFMSATTGEVSTFYMVKRSSGDTGGTSHSTNLVPEDSQNSAATATLRLYTANPATLGTAIGDVQSDILQVPSSGGSQPAEYIFDFTNSGFSNGIVLHNLETLALNFNGGSLAAGFSFSINVYWSEE